MAAETALLEVGALFAAVALVGALARWIDQSVIPFYILAGMVLSPYVLGRLDLPALLGTDLVPHGAALAIDGEGEFVSLGAELGIVFLLFFLGLEFNLDRLFASRDRIGKAGVIDLVNFVVGLGLGWAFFGEPVAAFFVAGIVYISSSAIITKSLIDLGWIANDEADPMLGILVFEDLVIAVFLAIASAVVVGGGGPAEALRSIGVGIGFILLLLAFVAFGTPFFRRTLDTGSHEFVVLRTVAVTVLIAGAALALGVSEAVAAFFVGMGFSSIDGVADLERLLEPIRDTFAAVFFFWIGAVTDPALFGGVVGLVAVAAVVTTGSKLVTAYWGGRVYDLDERRSLRVALGMTTRGEFSLIAASVALTVTDPGVQGTISGEVATTIYAFAVGYVLVMSVLGTTLMQHAGRIEARLLPVLESVTSRGSTASAD